MSLTSLKDVDREVLKHIGDRDLLKICSVDRKTWNEVCDDDFLRRRITSKYPGIHNYKYLDESWKEFFLRAIYYIEKMKEKFEFQYTFGSFKNQYDLLNKYQGKNLLLEAAKEGEVPLVKYSLEKGIDINSRDNYGLTALSLASINGKIDVVKYLVERGYDIHINNDEAFRMAVLQNHLDIVKYLLHHGANIRVSNNIVLKYAENYGHKEMLEYLKGLIKKS